MTPGLTEDELERLRVTMRVQVRDRALTALAAHLRKQPGGDQLLLQWAQESRKGMERIQVPGHDHMPPEVRMMLVAEWSEHWDEMLRSLGL